MISRHGRETGRGPDVIVRAWTWARQVERTEKGRWLPVYTDVRKGKTQLVTLVRRISGNVEVSGPALKCSVPLRAVGGVKEAGNMVPRLGGAVDPESGLPVPSVSPL
jgi:hypothetical protein